MTKTLYILDVFTEDKYAGNQLAVVRDAQALSTEEMQAIAREMHFSETTFILTDQERNGGYDVRIFTPAAEIPFAGHPTLGTAFVIQREIIKAPVATVNLNLKVGQIPVTFAEAEIGAPILWMKQIPPTFGPTCEPSIAASSLRLGPEEIDTRFPSEIVSTGLPFLIIPLKSLSAVKRAKPDWDKFVELTGGKLPRALLVFAPETYHRENQLNVRVFVDEVGVPEDPATGSGNGCLAGYLMQHRYFGDGSIDIRVEQGYEIQRPSLLMLKARQQRDGVEVNVGGRVVMVARGELV